MELVKEYYYIGYQPKLDDNRYAYYVDTTNCDLMYKIIEDYLYSIDASDIPLSLQVFKELIDDLDTLDYICFYFGRYGISYDGDTLPKSELDIFAVLNKYTIIKLCERTLMTIE